MELSLRIEKRRLRRSLSFTASVCLHASAVVWVAVGPYLLPDERPLYDREIRPNTQRIIWYSLRDQLPPISPAQQPERPQPPRALRPFSQPLVAGKRDINRPPQLIWTPAPELNKPQLVPSPNLVALAPARPQPRPFESRHGEPRRRIDPLAASPACSQDLHSSARSDPSAAPRGCQPPRGAKGATSRSARSPSASGSHGQATQNVRRASIDPVGQRSAAPFARRGASGF